MRLSLVFVLICILTIVSLAAIGWGMTIINVCKYLKLKKCHVGAMFSNSTNHLFSSRKEEEWRIVRRMLWTPYKILFASGQDFYSDSNKFYSEYNKLAGVTKVVVADLLHGYHKIMLIMQLICICFIMLIPPSISLSHSSCRTPENNVFFIPYTIFFLVIAVIVGIMRKRVAVVLSLIRTDASIRVTAL